MNRTENYQLPKWERTDRVMMEDFNDMTDKLDKGLGKHDTELAEHKTALAARGNCQVVIGTYTGTEYHTSTVPRTLSFSHKPLMVLVQEETTAAGGTVRLVMLQGSGCAFARAEQSGSVCTVTWEGNSVSWTNSNPAYQCNYRDIRYRYIALLAMDQ